MPLFLTIFEGESPSEAQPLLATHDPAIIAAVRRLLLARLGHESRGKLLPLPRFPKSQQDDVSHDEGQ
jgi:hypothetical protein